MCCEDDPDNRNRIEVSHEEVQKNFEVWILKMCKENSGFWLPVAEGMLEKLQAKPIKQRHARATRNQIEKFKWAGILQGGHKMPLPVAYVKKQFSAKFANQCMETSPKTQGCIKAGQHAPSEPCGGLAGPSSLATASLATVFVGRPPAMVHTQGKVDACVVCSVAGVLEYFEDRSSAKKIIALKAESLQLEEGAAVQWIKKNCRNQLISSSWIVHSLKDAANFDPVAFKPAEAFPGAVAVATIIRLRDSDNAGTHVVAMADGWLFDPNKPYAVELQQGAGLDACCIGKGCSFRKVAEGFHLVRGSTPRKRKPQPGDDQGAPPSKQPCLQVATCSQCHAEKPRGEFSGRQLKASAAKRRCKSCVAQSEQEDAASLLWGGREDCHRIASIV